MAKQLTVAELIEELKQMPQDYLVQVGDGYEPAVSVESTDDFIVIGRKRVLIHSVFQTDEEIERIDKGYDK